MTRAEILEEFGIAGVRWEIDYEHLADRLADEIAALRTQLAELDADRDLTFRIAEHNGQEAIKANAILAKLREPSEAVMIGAFSAGAVWDVVTHIKKTIRLAVAAAEKEVGNAK